MIVSQEEQVRHFIARHGESPEPAVIVGVVYRSVAGAPNVRAEPEELDARNYFALTNALAQRYGKRVRITIETLD